MGGGRRYYILGNFVSLPVSYHPDNTTPRLMGTEGRIQGTIRNQPCNDVLILYTLSKFLDSTKLTFYRIY